ncbi:MAG TPA: DUF4383 domain-containing protein [Ilumatobacteraceae bacterium]|jgi:hypothetical protein
MSTERDASRTLLKVFAPVLIGSGVLGFVVPEKKALTSGATAYNIFHLVFGSIGVMCARSERRAPPRLFGVGFGVVDLYQAVASRKGWFPARWFRWKTADDVLHVAIGAALIAAAMSNRID